MTKVRDDLFVLDCGVVQRAESVTPPTDDTLSNYDGDRTARAMGLARDITQDVRTGRQGAYSSAGRARGLSAALTHKYRALMGLSDTIQQSIVDGQASGRSVSELVRIARLPAMEQQDAYRVLLDRPIRIPRAKRGRSSPPIGQSPDETQPVRVRAVVMFNPRLFVDRRRTARRQLQEIEAFVRGLNRKLASPTARRSRDSIAGLVHRKLASYNLVSAFDVQIRKRKVDDRSRFQIQIRLDERQWQQRRRYDGFNILVAEPGISHSAVELACLYRQKDRVEKGFQTIKSVIELRPVRHHTDPKVRAHVSICMLALHLLRSLEARLGSKWTAPAALETLATCHINLYEPAPGELTAFNITRPDAEQRAILNALDLAQLTREQDITVSITPRS